MRKLICLLICLFVQISYAQKKVDVVPVIKKQAIAIISGNQNNYYSISPNKTITFSIKDYDKLIIYSREQITNNSLGYSISYNFDQDNKQSYLVKKKRKDYKSAFLHRENVKNVSLVQKKIIVIPPHVASVQIKSNSDNTLVKIVAYKGTQKKHINTNTSKKTTLISGKSLKYYKLNSKTPTLIETNKEGELVIYTRKRMSDKMTSSYSFTYNKQDTIRTVTINNVKKSTHTAYRSIKLLQTPSTFNKTILKIGDVYQKILFTSNSPVDARFVFKKTIRKNGWEEIESKNGKIVPLVVKKKKLVREYTRIEAGKPFQFSINNKEEIKIYIRGEFRYDMHANNDYEIILKDNNKIINTYKLSCHRSNIMNYKYNNELIPGSLDKFTIKVPKGKHTYSISINNSDKTALIRVLKKD